jgi:SAM-dependent methyltransferase
MFEKYHPAYIAARLARRSLPERLALKILSRRGVPLERLYETTRLYMSAFSSSILREDPVDIRGATLLEAGTGLYNPAAAPFMLYGSSRLILLEPYPGKCYDLSRVRQRYSALLRHATADSEHPFELREIPSSLDGPAGSLPPGVELLHRHWEDSALPSNSIDVIFSASVLEHVRNPEAVVRETARLLTPRGAAINLIDLRDHFFRYPLEMLKYSERAWRVLTTNAGGGGYQNRLRLPTWLRLFKAAGFETEVISHQILDQKFVLDKKHFAEPFCRMSDHDLRVATAILVSRPRHPIDSTTPV